MEEAAAGPSKKPRLSTGDGLTAFTLRLAKKLAAGEGGSIEYENLVFSPFTIYAALALVAAGARGSTLDEILLLLGAASRDELAELMRTVAHRALADGSAEGGPQVTFASGVWHDKTVALKPAYRAAAVECYNAVTRAADFKEEAEEAREEINKWVSEATNELVTSILPPGSVDSSTRLVLANAIYFNGSWAEPFARKHTTDRCFHRLDGSSVDAPFMRSKRDQFVARHDDGFKVLKLPYRHSRGAGEGPRLCMCVFLPDARDGLPCLMDRMGSDPSFLSDHMPRRRVTLVEFLLPKFKLSFSSRIDGVVKDMGIKAAFDEQEADLSDMLEGGPSVAVEQVLHKAVVEVNEEGTVAAASNAFIMRKCCRVVNPVRMDFIADHPFAFFVVEEVSGAVVFAGHVVDPTRSV